MLHVPAILMALCVSSALAWCEDEVAEPPPLSDSASADAILDEVAARLPREPIRIAGSLVADPRGGRPGRRCQVQVDLTYGADPALSKRLGLTRQWLHAVSLGFDHPSTRERIVVSSDYPEDLSTALDRLRAGV